MARRTGIRKAAAGQDLAFGQNAREGRRRQTGNAENSLPGEIVDNTIAVSLLTAPLTTSAALQEFIVVVVVQRCFFMCARRQAIIIAAGAALLLLSCTSGTERHYYVVAVL